MITSILKGLAVLLCLLSYGPLPSHGAVPLKLVDVPLVVCKGGPGTAVAKIWPSDMPSETFVKLGDGACSPATDAYSSEILLNDTEKDRMACEAVCTANSSCGAYDFCSLKQCTPRCRLFPPSKEYTAMSEDHGRACYVNQQPNASKPHVVTFLRSSSETSSVHFTLTDSSEERKTIVPHTNLTFEAFTVRRLTSADTIPRRGKGGSHGRGRSKAAQFGKGVRGRRPSSRGRGHLPSARTRSGQRAAGHFSNPKNPRSGSYGYGYRQLHQKYPLGYMSTPYGISGMSAYARHSPLMITSWLGGAYIMSRFSSMCQCAPGRPCNRCGVTHNGSDGSDDANWDLEDDLSREDVLSTGFIPEDYTYPLLLTVTSVSGQDYNESRICPPQGWDPSTVGSTPSWTPPSHQDLFFTITQLEDLAPEDSKKTIVVVIVIAIVVSLAIGIPLVAYCLNQKEERNALKEKEKQKEAKGLQLPKSFRRKYDPLPIAVGATT